MLDRRQLLSNAALGSVFGGTDLAQISGAGSPRNMDVSSPPIFDVRTFGATGDGKTTDSSAINQAIDAAASRGGGTVYFPAGTYSCFALRLRSFVCLYFDQGATILAAATPLEGSATGCYDALSRRECGSPTRITATTTGITACFGAKAFMTSRSWGQV